MKSLIKSLVSDTKARWEAWKERQRQENARVLAEFIGGAINDGLKAQGKKHL